MKKLRKFLANLLFKPLTLPKIIICIEGSGCMDQIKEFKWIGYVTKEYQKDNPTEYQGKVYHSYSTLYEVQPLIRYSPNYEENRDAENHGEPLKKETAWQIQHLGFNFYAFYK